jgi:hypothetical protein
MSSSNEKYGKLIFVHNWSCDSWISCLKPIDLAFACEGKFNLMVKLEAKFKNQVINEDFLDLNDYLEFHMFPMWRWFVHVLC